MRSFKLPEGITSRWRWIAASLGIIIISFSLWISLAKSGETVETEDPTLSLPEGIAGKVGEVQVTEEALKLAEIEVASAEVRLVREKITATGIVKTGGNQIAKITPQVGGEVVEIFALPGDQVSKGQVLARLASPELARAQADYRQAASRVEVMKADLARKRELAQLGQYGSAELETSRSKAAEAERGLFLAQRAVAEKEAELARAESNLEVLENRLEQAQAELEVRSAHYNRAKALPEVVSLQQLERLRTDFEKAEADVAVAEARISEGRSSLRAAKRTLETVQGEQPLAEKELSIRRQAQAREEKVFSGGYSRNRELIDAEADLHMALVELESTAEEVKLLGGTPGGGSEVYLRSPISGKVEEAPLTLGQHIDSEHLCFTVINLDRVWADLAVAPKDIPMLKVGDQVELQADSAPGRVYLATVTSIGSTTDETTRTVPVRVTVTDTGGALTAGSYVKATVVTDVRKERLTVPEAALQEHTGRATLYVAKPEQKGIFEVRHVTLGVEGEGWREIAEGLEAGEPLATEGTFYLKSEALKSSLSDGCCAVEE